MLTIYNPSPLYAPGPVQRLITADVFQADGGVLLFPGNYPNFTAHVHELALFRDGQPLRGEALWGKDVRLRRFMLPEGEGSSYIDVHLRGERAGVVKLRERPALPKVFLTACTLFKDDQAQLQAWVDYHARHGFERFVLYYNGPLDDILPRIVGCPDLLSKDIVLIPWPYTYWADGVPRGNEALLAEHGDEADISVMRLNWHHAQLIMLNHCLMFLRGTTEYIALFDLDEYFLTADSQRIADLVRRHDQDVYIFRSRWAELTSNRVPREGDDATFLRSEEIEACPEWEPFPSRTKYIGRVDRIYTTRVHYPVLTDTDATTSVVPPEMAGLYHFHEFSGKASRRKFVNPGGQWVRVDDFEKSPLPA